MKILLMLIFLLPFKEGEKLTLEVMFGPIKAGEMILEYRGIEKFGERYAYHFFLSAETGRTFSYFFKISDRIHSLVDTALFRTLLYEKALREGKYTGYSYAIYDPSQKIVIYGDGEVVRIPEPALDPLSVFYYVRRLPLEKGKVFYVPFHVDKKSTNLKIEVVAKDKVRTPMGDFDTFVVKPNFKGSGIFKSEGEMILWISDDSLRIPVMIRSKFFFGHLTAKIKKIEYLRNFELQKKENP